MIPEDQKNLTTRLCSKERHLTAAAQALNIRCIKLN